MKIKTVPFLSQGRKKRTITIKNGGSLEAKYNGINYQASDDEDENIMHKLLL